MTTIILAPDLTPQESMNLLERLLKNKEDTTILSGEQTRSIRFFQFKGEKMFEVVNNLKEVQR